MNQPVLGIIGGGQLGSMLSEAAKKIDIKTVVLSDDSDAPAKNFANITVVPLTGCVNKISRVPSLCSSEKRRIETAGIYIDKIQGNRENIGLSEASLVVSIVQKKRNAIATTKIIFNI